MIPRKRHSAPPIPRSQETAPSSSEEAITPSKTMREDTSPETLTPPGQTSGHVSPSEVLRPSENLPPKRRLSLTASEPKTPEGSPTNIGSKSPSPKSQGSPNIYSLPSTSGQSDLPLKAPGTPPKPRILEEYTIKKKSPKSGSKGPSTTSYTGGAKSPQTYQSTAKIATTIITPSVGSPILATRVSKAPKLEPESKKLHLMASATATAGEDKPEENQPGASTEEKTSPAKAEEQLPDIKVPLPVVRRRPPGTPMPISKLFDTKPQKRRHESSGSEKDDSAPSTPTADVKSDLENQDPTQPKLFTTTPSGQMVQTTPLSSTPVDSSGLLASPSSTSQPEDIPSSTVTVTRDSEDSGAVASPVVKEFVSDFEVKEDHFAPPSPDVPQRPETLKIDRDVETYLVVPAQRDKASFESTGTDSGMSSLPVQISLPLDLTPSCSADLVSFEGQDESQKESEETPAIEKIKDGDSKESPSKKQKTKKRSKGKSPKQKHEYLYTEAVCAAASGSSFMANKLKHERTPAREAADQSVEEKAQKKDPEAEKELEQKPLESQDVAGSEVGDGKEPEQQPLESQDSTGSDVGDSKEPGRAESDEQIAGPSGIDAIRKAIYEKPIEDITFSDVEKMSEHTEDWMTDVTDSDFDYDQSPLDFDDEQEEEEEEEEEAEEIEVEDSMEENVTETSEDEETSRLAGTAARTRVAAIIRRGGPAADLLRAVRNGDDIVAPQLVTPHLVQLAPDLCNRALASAAAYNMPCTVHALMLAGANPLWRMPVEHSEANHTGGRTAVHRATEMGALGTLTTMINAFDRPRRLARAGDDQGETPLHIAARRGDIRCLEVLLGTAIDPQPRNTREETPLHSAAAGGNVEAVELLLGAGAVVNVFRRRTESVLHVAAHYRRSEVVDTLIRAGANINAVDDGGRTALLIAIDRDAPLTLVQSLIAAGADVNHANVNGITPMHAAVTRKPKGPFRALLAAGAIPDVPNSCGCIPLHLAAFTGQIRKFHKLVHLAPDAIHHITLTGCTAFHSAVASGNLDLVQATISLGSDIKACIMDGRSAVHIAASTGNVTIVRYLASLGLSVNSRTRNGATPLHLAKTAEMVDALLQEGADGCAMMFRNETPLHSAAYHGRADVIRRLAQCLGINVDIRQVDGYTPLQIAAYRGNENAIIELVRLGADVNRRGGKFPSPLMFAARFGLSRAVKALANAGARADQIDPSNNTTPLHEAVMHQKTHVLKDLVNIAGAGINKRDGTGSTPLHLAVRFDNQRLVLRLIALGADPRALDTHGFPPIHYADHLSFKHCIEKLQAMTRLPFGAYSSVSVPGTGLAGGQTDDVALARTFLREYSLDVQRRRTDGKKALHIFCMFGNDPQVRGLLMLGDDPSAPMSYGLRPLHLAAAYGRINVIDSLLDSGVDIEALRDNEMTALHEAASHGRCDAIRLLMSRGANPQARQASGRTPALIAASRGHFTCVKELAVADQEFNVNDRDYLDITILHYAAKSGNAELVRWLVEKGAAIDAVERSGRTPLFHAVMSDQKGAVRELISLGANPHVGDSMATSPLQYAKAHVHLESIYLLMTSLIEAEDMDNDPPPLELPRLEE